MELKLVFGRWKMIIKYKHFFFIDGKSKNWVNLCDLDDSDELHNIIKSVGLSTFNGGFNKEDEEIDVKTFIEDAKFY